MRPGAAPPPRRGRRPLGPTPRYSAIPRWGLSEQFDTASEQDSEQAERARGGPSPSFVRRAFVATSVIVGLAVLAHVIRYALLLINRSILLNPILAGAVTWFGVALSVLALFAVIGTGVVLTNWLVARRAAAYAVGGTEDPRSAWEIRAGSLIPIANLLWAPVFVTELARVEHRTRALRRDVVAWWCTWALSYVLMIWAFATSFTRDPQAIADNTVTTIIAYVAGLAALVLAFRVFQDFERSPVDRPARRWVMVPDWSVDGSAADDDHDPSEPVDRPDSPARVETGQREPAA